MNKPSKKVKIGIWKRFETYEFQIAPSLAGEFHQFKYGNYNITIELPPRPLQKDWNKLDTKISCRSYRVRNNHKYPISYEVHSVDMILETNISRKIKEKALERVKTSLFNRREKENLDNISTKFENIADSAFENWINVLRWRSGIHHLCQNRENRQTSNWGTYLLDLDTRKRFFTSGHLTLVGHQELISKKAWTLAQKTLLEDIRVPIWHLYIAEAYQKLNLGDIRGFVIDLAIAIETIVRRVVRKFVKKEATITFEKMIDMIQIGRIIDDWQKLGFTNTKWKALKNEKVMVKQVIELRNSVMHRGEYPVIEHTKAKEMADAVLKFIKQCEHEIETTI